MNPTDGVEKFEHENHSFCQVYDASFTHDFMMTIHAYSLKTKIHYTSFPLASPQQVGNKLAGKRV